jgi:hypothetical protein
MRDAATRGRTVASFEGIDSIWGVYTHSSIAYVDSAGERRQTPTGPFGHYMEYWKYFHGAHNTRGPRRFCDAEREAFTDGAEVWYLLCGEWAKGVVVGGIDVTEWGEERVQILRPNYRDALGLQMTWCYTTRVRVPGARVGLDFQWETRGTERKASVFFCESCGSTQGTFGRSVYNPTYEQYGVVWEGGPIERGYDLADEHMLTPSVMDCTCRPTGGARIDSREYWRRVIAVEAAGIEVWDVPKQRSYQYYDCVVGKQQMER